MAGGQRTHAAEVSRTRSAQRIRANTHERPTPSFPEAALAAVPAQLPMVVQFRVFLGGAPVQTVLVGGLNEGHARARAQALFPEAILYLVSSYYRMPMSGPVIL